MNTYNILECHTSIPKQTYCLADALMDHVLYLHVLHFTYLDWVTYKAKSIILIMSLTCIACQVVL